MSLKLTYNMRVQADETKASAGPLVTNPTLSHIGQDDGELDGATAVPVTKAWSAKDRQLAGGVDSWDLTALAGGLFETNVDFTGLKVQKIWIAADAANTAGILIKPGATNPYELFGHAAGELTVLPGQRVQIFCNEQLADVAGGVKSVDLSSGDADAKYSVVLAAG